MNVEIKKPENLSPKKLKSFCFFSKDLKPILSAFKNLQPTTYPPERLNVCRSVGRGNLQPKKGFTLVELLVTLSLFVILSGIVLFSQQKFNGSILLTNLAYDVALTIRQAQTFGINVREDIKTSSFQNPYGVYFDTQNNNNKKFILFSDSSGKDGKYNGNWDCSGSGGDECLNQYSIKRGNYISDIKVTSPDCSPGSNPCSVKDLNITFLRPDPDAIFYKTTKSSGGGIVDDITDATIIISSANGDTRNVLVNSTGQISIGRGSGGVNFDFKFIGVATCDHSGSIVNTFSGGTWHPKNTQFDPYPGTTYSESTCGGHVPQKHKLPGGQSSGLSISCQSTEQSTASWYGMCVQNFTSCGALGLLDAGTNLCKHNDGVYP